MSENRLNQLIKNSNYKFWKSISKTMEIFESCTTGNRILIDWMYGTIKFMEG
jgi:hypothetical protein